VNKLFYLVFASAAVIISGTFLIYAIESPNEDSQIKTYLDAAWWTIATVTTVGYGDVVPVTEAGRAIALVYMLFGITILAVFLSVLGTRFYHKRFEKDERELSHGHKKILERIEELEKKQDNLARLFRDFTKK
jgi:voltage-gated potassium channel